MDAWGGFLFHERDGEVNFLLEQHGFEFGLEAFWPEADLQVRKLAAQILNQLRQMVAQHDSGRADADVPRLPALKLGFDGVEARKEGLMKSNSFFPGGSEREGAALKEGDAGVFLEPWTAR